MQLKKYKNISKVSGVESYSFDSTAYSYITVKFKTGEILTYTSQNNSVDQIRSLCVFAEIGVGLNRYLTKNKPTYVKGFWVEPRVESEESNSLITNKVQYPLGGFDKVIWNNGKDWVTVSWKDGKSVTYTTESTGKRDVIGIISAASKGYGLKQYIQEHKPTAVEETVKKM